MENINRVLWSSTDDLWTEQALEFFAAYRPGYLNLWGNSEALALYMCYFK